MEKAKDFWKVKISESKTEEEKKFAEEMFDYFSTPAFQSAESLPAGYDTIGKDEYLTLGSPERDYMGIIKRQTTKEELIQGIVRPDLHVADVYFDDASKGASPDKRWMIEVYDQSEVISITDSIQKVAQEFDVSVIVSLNREKGVTEKKFGLDPKVAKDVMKMLKLNDEEND